MVQRGISSVGVDERVDGGEEEVKCNAPKGQTCEVAEVAGTEMI